LEHHTEVDILVADTIRHGAWSNLLARSYGGSDVCCGSTPLLQNRFAQSIRVSLSCFRKLDYLVRDYIICNVIAINKPKGYERYFKIHQPDHLRVESLAI
jgi:hypothetical protein